MSKLTRETIDRMRSEADTVRAAAVHLTNAYVNRVTEGGLTPADLAMSLALHTPDVLDALDEAHAIIRALVSEPTGWVSRDSVWDIWTCKFCGISGLSGGKVADIPHANDCPVARAQEVLQS